MHNLYVISVKHLNISRRFAWNLVSAQGNTPQCGGASGLSEFEMTVLSMVSEFIGIANEFLLFVKLQEYKSEIPHINLVANIIINENSRHLIDLPLEKK